MTVLILGPFLKAAIARLTSGATRNLEHIAQRHVHHRREDQLDFKIELAKKEADLAEQDARRARASEETTRATASSDENIRAIEDPELKKEARDAVVQSLVDSEPVFKRPRVGRLERIILKLLAYSAYSPEALENRIRSELPESAEVPDAVVKSDIRSAIDTLTHKGMIEMRSPGIISITEDSLPYAP
ncbi:hypothetical protein [Falsirhodobacter sp. 1013]|uniref:hypothetical protein n=1 Tax=Falsirhodobacter sp. 1013 TaxID=3417566 RepID=UPI003EB79DA7